MTSQIVEDALENDAHRIRLIGEMDARELHEFLDRYNWDDGFAAVWAVIENPACELATALLAFWLCDPDRSSVPPVPRNNREHTRIVSELYTRINDGDFQRGSLPFDPDPFIVNRLQRLELERAGLPEVFMRRLPPRSV